MPRFAASLSMMFGEVPLPERFAAAASAGFRGVEIQAPYDHDAAELKALADAAGLEVVLINLPAGDAAAGERGLAGLPGREQAFDAAVEQGLDYARALGCSRVHAMAGVRPESATINDCELVMIDNLRRACAAAPDITFLVEPINKRDMPGYLVNRQHQARRIVEAVGAGNCRIQFDFYHCQNMEGDLARHFQAQLPLIGHLQIADNPGRHEPGSGEIGWPFLFDLIDSSGWQGWVGCEYKPAGDTLAGLAWAREHGIG